MNTLYDHHALADETLKRGIQTFFWRFNIRTEGLSFFVVVPFVLLYVWINIQFTPEQLAMFSRIWPPAFAFGIAFVLVNNWLVLRPVLNYFHKLLHGQEFTQQEYMAARERFLRLPYIHAVGAFFRWLLLLANAIVAMMILGEPALPQTINMWTGAGICAVLGLFSYFSITEAQVQDMLNRGLFARIPGAVHRSRFNLLPRLTLMTLGASLLPTAIVFAFFYITVETNGLGNSSMYIRITLLAGLGIFAGTISPYFLNKTIRGKVSTVRKFLDEIGAGDLDARPDNVVIEDEISQINRSVDDMRGKLKKVTGDLRGLNLTLEQKVEQRTEELQAAMEELEAMNENLIALNEELEGAYARQQKDLKMAASVQAAFMPGRAPQSADYDIAFICRPMDAVSGDFYDFYFDEQHRLAGAGLFDVSGHGISSGLLTLIARSIIQKNFSSLREEKLNHAVRKINEELISEIGHSDKYLTGILLRFRDDIVEYCNCGHPDAFFRVAGKDRVGRVVNREGKGVKGMFLGIAEMNENFEVLSLKLQKGDCLFLFSDCLLESSNPGGDFFGEDQIKASLGAAPRTSASDILGHVIADFDAFIGLGRQVQDDLTAMVIVRK